MITLAIIAGVVVSCIGCVGAYMFGVHVGYERGRAAYQVIDMGNGMAMGIGAQTDDEGNSD
jgi:hypothetical protein